MTCWAITIHCNLLVHNHRAHRTRVAPSLTRLQGLVDGGGNDAGLQVFPVVVVVVGAGMHTTDAAV